MINELQLYSEESIDKLVRKLSTPRKRSNARRKLRAETNKIIDEHLLKKRDLLREMRSEREELKRNIYVDISKLQRMKL